MIVYICRYCGKECKNDNSLRNHERMCGKNPKRQENPAAGKPAWNRGLTSKDDCRIWSGDKLRKRTLEGIAKAKAAGVYLCTGRGGTEEKEIERKRKISQSMKNNGCGGYRRGSGRGKKGWYKGYYCDSTYELVYVIYNLDHGISFKRCNRFYVYDFEGTEHKYYPDFELPDGTLVEIKGYYTKLDSIKINSVKDRSIKILFKNDLDYAFDWVKSNYSYKQLTDLYEQKDSV